MEKGNKVYLYKYFYALVMFLGILLLPFLLLTFETKYNDVLDEYHDAVSFAVAEEFTPATRNEILELQVKVEETRIEKHYNNFVSVLLIIIFLSLFNYFYVQLGIKHKTINNSPSMKLNKRLLLIFGIVEILYFVGLLIFTDPIYIGTNFWTLFFVNIVLAIFIIVISLQVEYILKTKEEKN